MRDKSENEPAFLDIKVSDKRKPGGIKTYEDSDSGLKALFIPLNDTNDNKEINKLLEGKQGLYFFLKSGDLKKHRTYIGLSTQMKNRKNSHSKSKSKNFDLLLVFINESKIKHRGQLEFLEHACIERIKKYNSAELDNKNDTKEPNLEERDRNNLIKLIDIMRIILGVIGYEILEEKAARSIGQDDEKIDLIKGEKPTQKLVRLGPLNFEDLGIMPGSKLSFVKDESYICEVFDDREVRYNGEIYSMNKITLKIQRKIGINHPSAQGAQWWKYKGKLLIDIRNEFEKKKLDIPSEVSKNTSNKRYPSKKLPFTFAMLKIDSGNKLYFSKDESITCEVVDQENKVNYKGQIVTLSRAASMALVEIGKSKQRVNGTLFWKYEGELLNQRRERLESKNR